MGVKCRVKRGWRSSHRWIDGVLWVEEVVEHAVHVGMLGHRAIDEVRKATELLGPVAGRHVGDDMSGGHVEGGVEVGGAVADVAMGATFGDTGHQGQSTTAASEGLR